MPHDTDRKVGQPTVSVIIPAYNSAPFIERAIRSALDQTHPIAELIVIDDASTDSTVEVVDKLRAADPRIKLLQLPTNGGPAQARNAGFALATSEWIAVLDADDAYLPGRLSHLMSRRADADILADNLLSYDPKKDAASPFPGPTEYSWEQVDLLKFADARRKHQDFGLFHPLFRRSFLEQHGLRYPENVRHGEDFLLIFEALAKGARYWLTWRPGYLYTLRNSGWSRTRVDYNALSNHLAALTKREDLGLSPAVLEKLTDRVLYTEQLHLRQQVKDAYGEGRLLPAIALAARHPRIWRDAFQKMMGALRRNDGRKVEFRGSTDYWERRYETGGNSGAGSYNQLAQFKADFLNKFVDQNDIHSIVEFGSGDGAQLKLTDYPSYIGIDVSHAAVEATRTLFAADTTKTFLHTSEVGDDLSAELSLSLDVIYHLVEDAIFETYMHGLFDASSRFVIIYSSDRDEFASDPHVRHRRFTGWVAAKRSDFELVERIGNPFPFDANDPDNTSFADFYVYARRTAT
jgi:hypothetical protein